MFLSLLISKYVQDASLAMEIDLLFFEYLFKIDAVTIKRLEERSKVCGF
jgi:hypothetical protein